MAAPEGRSHSNSAYSYFSSLPTTPTELLSPHGVIGTQQDASHPYVDRRAYRSGSGMLTMTSSTDSEMRKRTRAEQNREKMKAYHRRVMQQREALSSILMDMNAHVGASPVQSMRTTGGMLGSLMGEASSMGNAEGLSGGTASSIGRSAQEPSWSVSLRNKQKQESKARLRKREIDQVYELRLYANYASAILTRAAGGSSSTDSGYSRNSDGTSRSGEEQSTPWRQLNAQQAGDADVHMSHAILRVFLRHRQSWIALISAEQRLASEVAKMSPRTEEEMPLGDAAGSASHASGKGIKALIERVQMEERAGTLSIPMREPMSVLSGASVYDAPGQLSHGGAGMGASRSTMSGVGAGAQRGGPSPQYLGAGSYHQGGMMEAGGMALSPGGSEYGGMVSPSGVTRPMAGEEGDYFSQEARRFAGRYSGGSDQDSVLSAQMTAGYSPEYAGGQLSRSMAQAGAHRSGGSSSAMTPSVLSPTAQGGGYGYHSTYASEGMQQRMDAQEMQRQGHVAMSGMQQGQLGSSMQGIQLRVSTPYDDRGYAQPIMQDTPSSRFEQAPAPFHALPMQAQLYSYSNAQSQGAPQSQGQMQLRGNQSTPQAYPSHHQHQHHQHQQQQSQQQQHHYGQQQQGPYDAQH